MERTKTLSISISGHALEKKLQNGLERLFQAHTKNFARIKLQKERDTDSAQVRNQSILENTASDALSKKANMRFLSRNAERSLLKSPNAADINKKANGSENVERITSNMSQVEEKTSDCEKSIEKHFVYSYMRGTNII